MWMVMFFIFYFFWCFANIESKQWISHQAIRFPIKWNFTRHLQRELMHLYDMGMTNDRYFIGISIASQFQSLLLQPKLSITRDTVDAVLCPPPKKKRRLIIRFVESVKERAISIHCLAQWHKTGSLLVATSAAENPSESMGFDLGGPNTDRDTARVF